MIVTEVPPAKGAYNLDALVGAVAKEAFKRAADAKEFPEQIDELYLAPWGAKKIYAKLDKADPAATKLDVMEYSPRLGDTPWHLAAAGRRLVGDEAGEPATRESFRLLAARSADAAAHTSLLEGSALEAGGDGPPGAGPRPPRRRRAKKALAARKTLETLTRADAGVSSIRSGACRRCSPP